MTALPNWIDRDLWDEYVAQRKKDKKEMSPRSVKDRLAQLYELHDKGHDANASIADALNHHWLDFYEPRPREITNMKRAYMTSVQPEMTDAQRVASKEAKERALAMLKGSLRRVA